MASRVKRITFRKECQQPPWYAEIDLNSLKKLFYNKQEKGGLLNHSLLEQNLSERKQKPVKLRSFMNVLTQIAMPEKLGRVSVPVSC